MDRPLKFAIVHWNVSHENFKLPLGSLSLCYFKCVLALPLGGWIWQKLYECAIRHDAALTKGSKREWYPAWISWYCFKWKRLYVFLYIKPHLTKPRSSRKSLFSNSLCSASKMPSFQAAGIKQGSKWVDATWDDFWRLKCRSLREVTSAVECFALLILCTSLLWPCWQPNPEGALIFPSPSSVSIMSSSPLKIIIDFTSLLRICWKQLQLEI